jgi:hypothetical protein
VIEPDAARAGVTGTNTASVRKAMTALAKDRVDDPLSLSTAAMSTHRGAVLRVAVIVDAAQPLPRASA